MRARELVAAMPAAMGTAAFAFVIGSAACSAPASVTPDAAPDAPAADAASDRGCKGDACAPPPVAPTCPTPVDASGFASVPLVPPRPAQDACAPGAIDAYYAACLGKGATQQTCSAYVAQNKACASCIESRATDTAWGPLVSGSGVVSLHVSGCLALLGQAACAKAYQDAQDCGKAACDEQCPVTDGASFASYQKCRQAAAAGTCKSWVDAASTACEPDAAAIARCTGFSDFASGYAGLAPVFCASGG
jgi:hypothetical protein